MKNLYSTCLLCPRKCGVDRLAGEIGFCGEGSALRIAFAGLHKGEEPPLVGTNGSGTIFVSGCNLGCIFCQNYQISHADGAGSSDGAGSGSAGGDAARIGKEVSAEDFAAICAALQEKGAENINIVTGSHAVPAIIEGIDAARKTCAQKNGARLPVLWNSSAYENVETLELLREYVDVFLPDLKTLDSRIAAKFFNAPEYPEIAQAAILKMCEIASADIGTSAHEKVIVRHLILPGYLESTKAVLCWFADNIKDRALLSLMTQYTPIPGRGMAAPQNYLSAQEYETVLTWLEDFGIEDGFCQELVTGSDWLPDFKKANPFSSALSVPIAF